MKEIIKVIQSNAENEIRSSVEHSSSDKIALIKVANASKNVAIFRGNTQKDLNLSLLKTKLLKKS